MEEQLTEIVARLRLEEVRAIHEGARVTVTFRIDPDVLSSGAWALIFSLGAVSFRTAASTFAGSLDGETWSLEDMLQHLLFENGRLFFFTTSVRGREMNTKIEVDQDGEVLLETTNRGDAAVEWVAALQRSFRDEGSPYS